jgi:phosphatidylethanolamine-binding protein (PEBP) family uncharacterized protein
MITYDIDAISWIRYSHLLLVGIKTDKISMKGNSGTALEISQVHSFYLSNFTSKNVLCLQSDTLGVTG